MIPHATTRVVVTGLGWVTPLGTDVDLVWQALLAGERGVTAPQREGASAPPTQAVGEVPPDLVSALRLRHPELPPETDARTLFGHAAACAALEDAGLAASGMGHPEAGVVIGSGPGVHRAEDIARHLDADGRFDPVAYGRDVDAVHPGSLVRIPAAAPAATVARAQGLGGPVHAVTSACSAGNQALGMGLRLVRDGECPFVVAGGADSMIDPLGLVFFVLLGANAHVDEDPAAACRPFDRKRTGLVIGEGAGVVVLESLAHAQARGARIRAELVGYGTSFDAWRITAPPPDGRGAVEAMQAALDDAGIPPEDVDFVNAHGTGTKRNDPAEAAAIRTLLGSRAQEVPVSSGKGALGHLLSAASGVGFVLTVLAAQHHAVPPTVNLEQPGRGCDLDLVPGKGRAHPIRVALNNAFAFGGQNAVTAVRAWSPESP